MAKRIFIAVILAALLAVPVLAAKNLVVDQAQLLTGSEYNALSNTLENLSQKLQMDIVIVTVPSLDGKSAMDYADDYYDYNGYGPDGVLLLVAMSEREYWISTTGRAIQILSGSSLSRVEDSFHTELSAGNYADAFYAFAYGVEAEIVNSEKVNPAAIVVCLLIGAVAGFIVTGVMKANMKSVRPQRAAWNYMVPGSLDLTGSRDIYLYRNVTRRAKPKNNSSSAHTGSSGRSHGGGGGRF